MNLPFSPEQMIYLLDMVGIIACAMMLAEWILVDGLPVRFGLQLHKIIWADAKGK